MERKTTPQVEQKMYEALEELMKEKISGGFYESDCRPADSRAEDAVLTVVYANASQIQAGRAKINIYVPDVDCGLGRPVPDKARIQELSKIDREIIETLNQPDTDYLFYLTQGTHSMIDPETNQHFVNINIGFRTINF